LSVGVAILLNELAKVLSNPLMTESNIMKKIFIIFSQTIYLLLSQFIKRKSKIIILLDNFILFSVLGYIFAYDFVYTLDTQLE
jgi:hypothetical protein